MCSDVELVVFHSAPASLSVVPKLPSKLAHNSGPGANNSLIDDRFGNQLNSVKWSWWQIIDSLTIMPLLWLMSPHSPCQTFSSVCCCCSWRSRYASAAVRARVDCARSRRSTMRLSPRTTIWHRVAPIRSSNPPYMSQAMHHSDPLIPLASTVRHLWDLDSLWCQVCRPMSG